MSNENNLSIISEITLDLATYSTRVSLPIKVKQGDTGTRYIKATITKNGESLTIEQTAKVYINFSRSDSAVRIYSGEVEEDGTLLFLIPEWVTELGRDVSCDITILEEVDENGYMKITTPTFSISASKVCVPSDAVQADETGDLMLGVLRDLQDMAANEERRNEDVASAVEKADAAAASANEAAERAGNAADDCEAATGTIEDTNKAVEEIKNDIANITIAVDDLGLYQDENGIVYPTYRGEISGNGIYLSSSSGGSGGGATYTITLSNLLDSRNITIAQNGEAEIKFSYQSVDTDGVDDGNGVGVIFVNDVRMATFNAVQGENTIDVGTYVSVGTNNIKIKVENSDGSSKTLAYVVTVVALSIETTFNEFTVVEGGSVRFYYTVNGSGTKTIHFLMDGVEFDTLETTVNGRMQLYVIPEQTHGAHTLQLYAETTTSGITVKSNTLTLGMLWILEDNPNPAVEMLCDTTSAIQGENITVSYLVYTPGSETSSITLSVLSEDNTVYSSSTITVDRSAQKWVVQDFPVGAITLKIESGNASATKTISVTESTLQIEHVTDSLVLLFDPTGRSNNEDTPATWTDGTTTATFNNVGFAKTDGWLTDDDGNSVLRLLPGETMTLPYELFSEDARTNGIAIEAEIATHNVRDYDSIVMNCTSSDRGFKIASQYATLQSEQSGISVQFKEDEKVRVSFVVEPRTINRLIYVYINGVMCGAIQYPDSDHFTQNPAVGITIGAETSGIDIYRIYLYNKYLTRSEILENYIADRGTLAERVDAYTRNDILNESEEVVISKLPATLPYMIISCDELPQYKGDKKTCSLAFVNPSDTSKSFTAEGVQIDVQGTSSSGYKKKNFKIKLKNGLTYSADNTTSETFQLRDTSIPEATFTLKADVASSEGANNVELVRLYNDLCYQSVYKTPPQETDYRVRVGIDGFPMVIFWQNTTTNAVKFWGKYNFNNDKGTPETFGLTDGCESWEVLNNTSNRCLFKTSDYTSTKSDGAAAWLDDFEARYPEDNTDYTNLKRLTDWIVSTDRSAVTSASAKATRLSKFKSEFENYFVKAPTLFYYLFTEVFLMVDSRAKNLFPTTYDGVHWLPLPYDFDTAIGINNEGSLAFDYNLEDSDTVDGANVFNGQDSVLWINVRDAFSDDLKTMYGELRSSGLFNFDSVVERFKEHQEVWAEAIWNEDAYEKYIEPLLTDNNPNYLPMLQGNKASQREWWLYNAFKYRDSKYQTGDATGNFITLRCYANGDITVTPYSHIYVAAKFGANASPVTERTQRNTQVTLPVSVDNLNDTETYIYSADRLIDVGDLSPLQVGYADFSAATKLTKLKLGDSAEDYQNTHLNTLNAGNNDLLTEVDIQNCVALNGAVDLSQCDSLETVLAKGSTLTGVSLPIGGKVKTLELPATVTNFEIRDQKQLETVTFEGYSNISTLRVENTPNVPFEDIINGSGSLQFVRLINIVWNPASSTDLMACLNKLMTVKGLTVDGGETTKAVVSGVVNVDSISTEDLEFIYDNFSELEVYVNGEIPVITYSVVCNGLDGTQISSESIERGATFTKDFTGLTGEYLPETFSVTVRGVNSLYEYDIDTGVFTLSNVKGNVVITVTGLNYPTLDAPTLELGEDEITLTVTVPDDAEQIVYFIDGEEQEPEAIE